MSYAKSKTKYLPSGISHLAGPLEILMPGFIYIMSNPAYKDGRIKIGKSDRDPTIRQSELFTTGVPEPFRLEYYALVDDHHKLEIAIHRRLGEFRASSSREFFICSIPVAITKFRELASKHIKYEEVLHKSPIEVEAEQRRIDDERRRNEEERLRKLVAEKEKIEIQAFESKLASITESQVKENKDYLSVRVFQFANNKYKGSFAESRSDWYVLLWLLMVPLWPLIWFVMRERDKKVREFITDPNIKKIESRMEYEMSLLKKKTEYGSGWEGIWNARSSHIKRHMIDSLDKVLTE